MRLKDLESALSELASFTKPLAHLEQYPTSAHLAAHVMFTMHETYDDIEGKMICDLGCGTGTLSIAAAIIGAAHITACDIDASALEVAVSNSQQMEIDVIDFCMADLTADCFFSTRGGKWFDTVIMNPPFGTKRKGVDMMFLQRAVQICHGAVYSMHKTSTRGFIRKTAESWGARAEVIAEVKFDIGRMYKFHTSNCVDVEVDLWRFDVASVPADCKFVDRKLPDAAMMNEKPPRPRDDKRRHNRGRGRGRGRGMRGMRGMRGR